MPFFVKGEQITLKADGTWIADGVEITHEQTRELFNRSVKWDALERKYYLEVGYERMFIEVEDTPYFVTAIQRKKPLFGRPKVEACLSNGSRVALNAERLHYRNEKLYLDLDNGLKAKFQSAAFYDFMKDLSEDAEYYYVLVNGKRANLSSKAS